MLPVQERSETDIGDYLAILRRRWPWILGTMIVAMGIVVALDMSKAPLYSASAQLLLQAKQSESIFQPGGQVSDPARAVQNELKIISSAAVRKAVAKEYGSEIGVAAASGGADDVIILTATDTDPTEAARKVNVYARTYQTQRLAAILDDLTKSKLALQQQINDFQGQIDKLNEPLAAIDAQLETMSFSDPRYATLVQERQRLDGLVAARRVEMESQLREYQQRLQILQVSERLSTTGGVQILNPATVPSSPISPRPMRDAMQAALIGALLGVGLTLLLEQLDDSVRTTADLEKAAKDLPVLGLIPLDEAWKGRNEERVSTQAAPMSATSEAYRGLRTALQYLALNRPMGVVQVTSASASEGKSSLIANLAIAFAQAGLRVAVVGCDLRKPRAHRYLKVDGSVGITSVLLGTCTLDEALQQSPIHPNIRVLPSGPRPPNPSELLSLDRTGMLIRSLLDEHSVVFVDCPPVLPVTDSLVLSRCVDASLFVAMANFTSKREVKRAVERLRQVNSPLVGTVLNGVSAERTYRSLYRYYGQVQQSRIPIVGRWFTRSVPDLPPLDDAEPQVVEGRRRSRRVHEDAQVSAATPEDR